MARDYSKSPDSITCDSWNYQAPVTAQAPWSVSATDLRRDLHWLSINQRVIYKLSLLTYKALHTGQPCYLADLIEPYRPSRVLRPTNSHLLAVPSCPKCSFASQLFVYLRLIIGTLFLCISAHLTVLLLSNPVLNLIFLLLSITSSHSHTSASDSTFDYWRYLNISLTLIFLAGKSLAWDVTVVNTRDVPNIRFVFTSVPKSGLNSLFVFGRIASS